MANKLSEKELNNVSGGCGGKSEPSYVGTLYCYDASNNLIDTLKTEQTSDLDVAKVYVTSAILSALPENRNIDRIEWEIKNTKTGEVVKKGTN